MGKELLSVPEEKLPQVTAIIREGIARIGVKAEDAVVENLIHWCNEMDEYTKDWDVFRIKEE